MSKIIYGCDIDMRHGAITKLKIADDGINVLSAQSVYRWGGKGSFTLGMKDDFPTMMRWSQSLADAILVDEAAPYPVYIEWDKARVHYRHSNKMAVVQLAQAIGAIAGYIGPHVKLVTPREVKLLRPNKNETEQEFKDSMWEFDFKFKSGILETFDTKGDYPDSIAAGLTGYRNIR